MGQCRCVVGAVARHGNQLPLGLLRLDEAHLRFRRRLGKEIVDTRFGGNRGGSARVVAGDHNRANAHGTEALETFLNATLDDVLEVNDAQQLCTVCDGKGRAAGVGDAVDNGI